MLKAIGISRIAILTFIVTAIPAGSGFAEESGRPLTLEIRSDKDVYTRGEDIAIGLTFKNNSGGSQILKFDEGNRLHAFFSFEISRDGKQVKAYRNIDTKGMQFPMMEKQLLPGESYSMDMVINRLDWHRSVCPTGSPFDKNGSYDIRVIYFGVSAVPEDNVISNTISIEVKGKNIFGWHGDGMGSVAEASEQQVRYTDMIEAYEQKRYADARALARRHLEKYSALAASAKNDFDLEAAVRGALGVMHSALEAESVLAQENENASARDTDFLFFLKKELERAKATASRLKNTSAPVRAFIEQEIRVCDSLWHRLGKDDATEEQVKKAAQPLTLTIQADKKVYRVGEKINVTASIKNLGDNTAKIYSPAYWGASEITVTNSKGMAMKPRGVEIERTSFELFLTIPSQSSAAYTFDNLTWFHCAGAWRFVGDALLPPDTYQIYVTIAGMPKCAGARYQETSLKGTLSSNVITITIAGDGRKNILKR